MRRTQLNEARQATLIAVQLVEKAGALLGKSKRLSQNTALLVRRAVEAYDIASERERIVRGRPLPGSKKQPEPATPKLRRLPLRPIRRIAPPKFEVPDGQSIVPCPPQ